MGGSFTHILGFLIVFRTGIAYNRFWDGAAHLQTIRGGWLNVVSSCFAFCSQEDDKKMEVQDFQHTLMRLMSLLYAGALHEVSMMDDNGFEILDPCFDQKVFNFMENHAKKVEILVLWVQ